MTGAGSQQNLPPDMAAQLAQLRDIHLPGEVPFWPPAPGWWILLAVFLLGLVSLCIFEIRRRRSLKYRALRELEPLKGKKAGSRSALEVAIELCILIRRVMLNQADGGQYASMHGEAWGEHLAAGPNGMPLDLARFIANAPYALNDPVDTTPDLSAPETKALVNAAEQWIRRHA